MTEILLGPPGTGKTTALLSIVDEELVRGTPPDRIGFVTFTRRAAEEAISRACAKFKLTPKDLPYFRTLHSLCFRQLGLRSSDVLEGRKLQEFADYARIRITGAWSEDGTWGGFEAGDRIMFLENLARVRQIPLREAYDADDDGLSWAEVDRVARALKEFKRSQGLLDYTDMLNEFVKSNINLNLQVVLGDEQQDSSALQWRVFEKLSIGARRVVVAGDDDQAIYRWAGADVDHLIDLPGHVHVLGQSYRVPPAVQIVAGGLIKGVRHRREKIWAPRENSNGAVQRYRNFSQSDLGDTWVDDTQPVLILARNSYIIRDQIEPELKRQGIIYERHGYPSIKASILSAVRNWETLRTGGSLTTEDTRNVYEFISSGRGVQRGYKTLPNAAEEETWTLSQLKEKGGLLTDTVWYDALDRIPRNDVNYIRAARSRGEKLSGRPRVRLSTIHGAKGGEAHHVILFKEMARRTYREMEDGGWDDERRCFYVGVTRAKEKLSIIESMTQQSYPGL